MYRCRSKLACLSKPVKMADNNKNTSFLCNITIFQYIMELQCIIVYTPGVYTIKHHRFVMYRFRSKLVCLSKQTKTPKTLVFYLICPFSAYYEPLMLPQGSML